MANEHSQIVPSMQPTAKVADFKFWCQKVLPLVYDDSLSYYEVLNKMVVYLNQVIDNINADIDNVEELEDDFLLLQEYVNNFFDDIDQLVTYAERAEAAETSAISYAASAAESASNSATSASNSASSASSSATSALSAMDARDAAVAAKTAAETALATAQTAATNAANSATTASGAAINAQTAASAASTSATLADAAAQTATSKASEAEAAAETCEEVLESIPEEYSDLSADVVNLKAALNNKLTGNFLGIINAQLDKYGSRTAQTGNNQSLLEVAGNYWAIQPTSETPSTTQITIFYCPHNHNVTMQTTLSAISNQIIAQKAFLTLPSNATSLTIKCERIKHNAGTSYGSIPVIVYDSNDTQVTYYSLNGGNAPQDATDYYDVIERTLTASDNPELFANKKFAIVMARLWPFFNLEGQMTLSVGTS